MRYPDGIPNIFDVGTMSLSWPHLECYLGNFHLVLISADVCEKYPCANGGMTGMCQAYGDGTGRYCSCQLGFQGSDCSIGEILYLILYISILDQLSEADVMMRYAWRLTYKPAFCIFKVTPMPASKLDRALFQSAL